MVAKGFSELSIRQAILNCKIQKHTANSYRIQHQKSTKKNMKNTMNANDGTMKTNEMNSKGDYHYGYAKNLPRTKLERFERPRSPKRWTPKDVCKVIECRLSFHPSLVVKLYKSCQVFAEPFHGPSARWPQRRHIIHCIYPWLLSLFKNATRLLAPNNSPLTWKQHKPGQQMDNI